MKWIQFFSLPIIMDTNALPLVVILGLFLACQRQDALKKISFEHAYPLERVGKLNLGEKWSSPNSILGCSLFHQLWPFFGLPMAGGLEEGSNHLPFFFWVCGCDWHWEKISPFFSSLLAMNSLVWRISWRQKS